jgi:ribosomal protein S6E (S10)
MKTIGNNVNKNIKKIVVALCVILLLGSIFGSGITVGSKPRGYVLPSLIDLNLNTGYAHQNITIYGAGINDFSGRSVAIGDVNDDGIDDIIIGASSADGPSARIDCGAIYVIFGSTSLSTPRDLSNPGHYNVVVYGAEAGDHAGESVAAGDIDGDGDDDLIIGATEADGPGNSIAGCGEVYVILGSTSLSGPIDLLSTAPDVLINGVDENDFLGWQTTTGDVNGNDGIDDLIISAFAGDGPSTYDRDESGEVYILNGKTTWSSNYNLNTTSPDVTIYGIDKNDQIGQSLATGNLDGSGNDDLVIGAHESWGPGNNRWYSCGEVYMINGATSLSSTIYFNSSDGSPNYDLIIYGMEGITGPMGFLGDMLGYSVACGDVSGDALDDIIMGAPGAKGPGNARDLCGEVYVIDGNSGLGSTTTQIDLASGSPWDVRIFGADTTFQTGWAVGAGDLNNDSKSEIIFSAPQAFSGPAMNLRIGAGLTYIINGTANHPATIDTNMTTVTPHHNITIWGGNATDHLGMKIASGDVNGDYVADLLIGADQGDGAGNGKFNCGNSYVIYGSMPIPPDFEPWIKKTTPKDGDTGVLLNAPIIVNFSEPMDITPALFTFTFSDPSITLTPNWNANNDGVNFTHTTPFDENTEYQINITAAQDTTGKSLIAHPTNPLILNPWNFTTGDFTNPMVTLTSPVNDSTNVNPVDGIAITFSEEMMTPTTNIPFTCQPSVSGGFSKTWDAANLTLIFNHTQKFDEKKGYWFNITGGTDLYGLPLVENPSIPHNIYFVTGDFTAPSISSTTPLNDTTGIALNATVSVTFSERMKTTGVILSDDSGKDLGWQTGVWSNNNKTITWDHSTLFDGETWYNITVSGGKDLVDNPMVPGIAPNPFRFKTVGVGPQIVATTPEDGATNVQLNADIKVEFSLPMSSLAADLSYSCDPLPTGGFTASWVDSKNVTFSHVTDFEKKTLYNFTITGAKDTDGNQLSPSAIPNPWSFTTIGDNPWIEQTTPAAGAKSVALDKDIVVKFNIPMVTSSVTYTCSPTVAFTPEWNLDEDTVTFKHTTDFNKNQEYTFEITAGNDKVNNLPLVPGDIPNPWNFTTVGDEPVIIETSPADGDTSVYLMADIVVIFSEPMQTSIVSFICSPDPGGWSSSPSWNPSNEIVTFSHANPFVKNTEHTFKIAAGKDMDGLDLVIDIMNPFKFTTAGDNPMIIETSPESGAKNVGLDDDIVITFSKAMDTATVLFTLNPPVTLIPDWSVDKKEVTYSHATEFAKNQEYQFRITAGKDTAGYDLITGTVDNPFKFTTIGDNPVIDMTKPAHLTTGVALDADIIVEFSKPMNTGSVTLTVDSPPAGGFTSSWNEAGDTVTFSHAADFIKETWYEVEIVSGTDLDGRALVDGSILNPWQFRTVGDEPVIESTVPEDKQKGVDIDQEIIITFSEAMASSSVTYTITSPTASDPGGWSADWDEAGETLTLEHNKFDPNTKYQFKITGGTDQTSVSLIAGPVPNPFEFTTGTDEGKDFITKLSVPPNNEKVTTAKPTITWEATENATSYKVYLSTDRSSVENLDSSALVYEGSDTSYTPSEDLAAGTVYYWTVIPNDGTKDGTIGEVRTFTTPDAAAGEKDDDKEEGMDWLWLLILIIIIVVVVIIVVLVMRKKEPEPEPEEPREEVPPVEGAPAPEAEMPPTEEMAAIPPPEVAAAPEAAPEAAAPTPEMEQYETPPTEPAPAAAPAAPAAPPAAPAVPEAEEPIQPDVEPVQPEEPVQAGEEPVQPEEPTAEGEETPEDQTEGAVCPVCSAAIAPGQTECPVCGASVTE